MDPLSKGENCDVTSDARQFLGDDGADVDGRGQRKSRALGMPNCGTESYDGGATVMDSWWVVSSVFRILNEGVWHYNLSIPMWA